MRLSHGDGGAFSITPGQGGTTANPDNLAEGRYELSATVTAANAYGDTVSEVSSPLILIVDRTPPVLHFTLPARYSLTESFGDVHETFLTRARGASCCRHGPDCEDGDAGTVSCTSP